ncbi:MAG: cation transporter [Clostridia bacterium]|nr:cation transporter [Clostridia bacterium]
MNTKRNILIAFLLNLIFSVFEFFGGIISGSSAILSDAVHDLGDALSIGVSFFLERKSKREADEKYTFGYTRYSILGSIITTLVLLIGSCLVVYGAVRRLIDPSEINYNEMILFAVIGVVVNLSAALITRKGESLNQRAVNLHMLEDTFGWFVVLAAAIIMRFTDITYLDPLTSIAISLFIIYYALLNLKSSFEILLGKCPSSINFQNVKSELQKLDGVNEIKLLQIWSLDENNVCAILKLTYDHANSRLKEKIRNILIGSGVTQPTIELLDENEDGSVYHFKTERNELHHHHH